MLIHYFDEVRWVVCTAKQLGLPINHRFSKCQIFQNFTVVFSKLWYSLLNPVSPYLLGKHLSRTQNFLRLETSISALYSLGLAKRILSSIRKPLFLYVGVQKLPFVSDFCQFCDWIPAVNSKHGLRVLNLKKISFTIRCYGITPRSNRRITIRELLLLDYTYCYHVIILSQIVFKSSSMQTEETSFYYPLLKARNKGLNLFSQYFGLYGVSMMEY